MAMMKRQDLMDLNEANGLLDDFNCEKLKSEFHTEITDYRELILSYQDYMNSTYVGTFKSWADLYNRRCH